MVGRIFTKVDIETGSVERGLGQDVLKATSIHLSFI